MTTKKQTTAIAETPKTTGAVVRNDMSSEQLDLLKRTICQGATDDEFQLFAMRCKQTGLDPFTGQIHAVKRWDSKAQREVMSMQVGIDGFRLQADRTGKFGGYGGTWWCGEDGEWRDVWLSKDLPAAAKVEVIRTDFEKPVTAIALFKDYASYTKSGSLMAMWAKMPAHMIAKCAESGALRKAFPNELSDLHTQEEIAVMNDARHAAGSRGSQADPAEEPASERDIEYMKILAQHPTIMDSTYCTAIMTGFAEGTIPTVAQSDRCIEVMTGKLREKNAEIPARPGRTTVTTVEDKPAKEKPAAEEPAKQEPAEDEAPPSEEAAFDRSFTMRRLHALGNEIHGKGNWASKRLELVQNINPEYTSAGDLTDDELREAVLTLVELKQ